MRFFYSLVDKKLHLGKKIAVQGGLYGRARKIYELARRGSAQVGWVKPVASQPETVKGVGILENGIESLDSLGLSTPAVLDDAVSHSIVNVVELHERDSKRVERDVVAASTESRVVDGRTSSVPRVEVVVKASRVVEY